RPEADRRVPAAEAGSHAVAPADDEHVAPYRAALVRVDVGPEHGVALGQTARAAAREPVVERGAVERHAGAHVPVVRPRGVRVDVVRVLTHLTVVVPAGPLVEIDHAAAKMLRRHVAAELNPVVDLDLVGAAEEAEIVDVEAGRLEVGRRGEADLLAADLAQV